MANANVVTVTDSSFESDVVQSSTLAVVDFWAEWCGPCKALAPTIDALANDFAGKVKVCKVNVDENPEIPSRLHIRGIPTLIFFKNGKPVDQLVGNHPKDAISDKIKEHI